VGRTNLHTGRLLSVVNPVYAEGAFVHISFRVRISRVIRTRGNAGPTTYTIILLNQYDASVFIMAGSGRAATYAG